MGNNAMKKTLIILVINQLEMYSLFILIYKKNNNNNNKVTKPKPVFRLCPLGNTE